MLSDSERRFRMLAEVIPVICWTANASGWIDWYNPRWYEFTGQIPEEAEGWGWQVTAHPDDFLEIMRKWSHSLATGEAFEMELRMRRRDGVFHWFLARAEPMRDENGQIMRWYGSHVDINEQKLVLERTKTVAETLQRVFLPEKLPQKADLRLDAVYLPAEKDGLIGGDWYDAFELPDGRLIVSIGDVCGHGLQASVVVGRLRQAVLTLAFKIEDPAELLREIDHIHSYQNPDVVVTALVGMIDPSHTVMVYAAAGHPPPLIADQSGELARVLPYGDLPLGVDGTRPRRTHRVPIKPGAVIALYTDGMTEFTRDVLTVEKKLRASVALLVGNTDIAHPAAAVQEMVFEEMPPQDDAALLLMQFLKFPTPLAQADTSHLEKEWRFHSSDVHTVHRVRQEISTYLRDMAADGDQTVDAEIVVGEILANTLEHASGLTKVHIDWATEEPVITVRDAGPGLKNPSGQLPGNIMSEKGRGFFLIKNLLKNEVFINSTPGEGTELRAVLPVRRRRQADAR